MAAPYVSFRNKRPHSAFFQGTSANAGLTTAEKRYGTGSYFATGNVGSPTLGLFVPTQGNQNIQANQDFYLSAWIFGGAQFVQPNLTQVSSLTGGPWNFGIIWNTIGTSRPQFGYLDSALGQYRYMTVDQGAQGALSVNSNGWCRYEAFRIGSTLTFRFSSASTWQGNTGIVPVSTTRTYSGAIDSTGTNNELDNQYIYFQNTNSSQTSYLDDFFFAKGRGSVQSTINNGQIDDGALETTEWLFRFDQNYQDTTTGTVQFASQLTSAASTNIQAGKQVQAVLAAASNFNLSANSVRTVAGDAAISSASNLNANLNKILRSNIELSSVVSQVIAVGRIRPFVALEVSAATLSANVSAISSASAGLTANSAVSAVVAKNVSAIINISAATSTTTDAIITSGILINLQVEAFTLTASGRIRSEIADLDSEFNLSITANKTREVAANLLSSLDLVVAYQRIRNISSTMSANTSLVAVTQATIPFTSTEASTFTLESTGRAIRTVDISLAAISQSQTILEDRTRDINLDLIAFASQLSATVKTGTGQTNLEVTSSISITVTVITATMKSDLVSTSSLTVTASRIRDQISLVAFNSTLTAQAGKIVRASASLACEGFSLAIARKINLEDAEGWKIPRETRAWIITKENNQYTVEVENRIYKIKGD